MLNIGANIAANRAGIFRGGMAVFGNLVFGYLFCMSRCGKRFLHGLVASGAKALGSAVLGAGSFFCYRIGFNRVLQFFGNG